jgi:hypothetical protein
MGTTQSLPAWVVTLKISDQDPGVLTVDDRDTPPAALTFGIGAGRNQPVEGLTLDSPNGSGGRPAVEASPLVDAHGLRAVPNTSRGYPASPPARTGGLADYGWFPPPAGATPRATDHVPANHGSGGRGAANPCRSKALVREPRERSA